MDNIDIMLSKEYAVKREKAERKAMSNLARARKVPTFVKLEKLEKELVVELAKLKANSPKDAKVKEWTKMLAEVRLQKKKLLKMLGLTEDDLQPKYNCNKCFDTGYVAGKMCDCLRTRKNTELAKMVGISTNDMLDFEKCNLDLISDPAQKAQMVKLKDYLSKWSKKYPNVKSKNITICGSTGLGKTHLSKCLAGELAKRGFAVCFVTAFEMNQIFLASHTSPSSEKNKRLAPLIKSDVLIVDDLGTEPTLKNVTTNYLNLILSEREEKKKPVVITTNLMPENVMDRYNERVYSRLFSKKDGKTFHLTGKDLRLQATKEPQKEM